MLSVFLPFCQGIRLLAIPELEYWQLLNFVLFEFLGISFGVVRHHFGNKENLSLEVSNKFCSGYFRSILHLQKLKQMSLQNKRFWMVKGSAHISDRETVFDTPSKIEPKRPHQWFVDEAEVDFLPNKKQAVEDAKEKSSSGFSNANFTSWENNPNCHSAPNQFIGRLFGSETKPINFTEKNTSYVSADDSNVDLHEAYNGEVETRSASIGQGFDKDGNVTLMGLTYRRGDAHVRSFGSPFGKGDNTVLSISESYNKDDTNVISFGGFPDERDIISVGRPAADYEQLYNQSSVHLPTIAHEKKLDTSNSDVIASTTQAATVKSENVSKNKQDIKTVRKETPNSFPSNVRSLISTGMLDGVPIKYVSVAREELRGIIKGSGYLCGCQSCNYSKVLNAYEFERHAGCKTKHPNNHIYFENGKTIYQIVQELRSTPESLLFDTIQTVFGAPINQKAFRNWKESYQAATRELQRIYGKEELKL